MALEKEELEKAHQQLIEEHGQLRYRYVGLDLREHVDAVALKTTGNAI